MALRAGHLELEHEDDDLKIGIVFVYYMRFH